MMKHAALACALVFTGCASTPAAHDYDPGSTPAPAFSREAAGCEMQAEASRTRSSSSAPLVDLAYYHESYNRVFDACMRSKGYARKSR